MVDISGRTAVFEKGEQEFSDIADAVEEGLETAYPSKSVNHNTRSDVKRLIRAGGREAVVERLNDGRIGVDFEALDKEGADIMAEVLSSLAGVGSQGRLPPSRRKEILEDEFGRNSSSSSSSGSEADWTEAAGGTVSGEVEHHMNGSISFKPRYTKDAADYMTPDLRGFEPGHSRCHTCAHYIEGGGCHLVQGEIDPKAYCESFYADITISAHEHIDGAEINLIVWGDDYNWSLDTMQSFIDRVRKRLKGRSG